MVGNELKILKICLSGLAEIVVLESFLYTSYMSFSTIFFVTKFVVFLLAYLMSNIVPILKGQKILLRRFLVKLGEKFLEFYLLLIGLFFVDRKDKHKISITVHFPPNNYFELKSIFWNTY